MARQFSNANVGTTGRRRIVPMMGIDFIAGDIKRKVPEYGAGAKDHPYNSYGTPPASMGGRTRKWSTINFLQVNKGYTGRAAKPSEIAWRQNFATASKSAAATVKNPAALNALMTDWRNGATYLGQFSNRFATMRGWVTAVRMAQIGSGIDIQPTTNTWPPQVTP